MGLRGAGGSRAGSFSEGAGVGCARVGGWVQSCRVEMGVRGWVERCRAGLGVGGWVERCRAGLVEDEVNRQAGCGAALGSTGNWVSAL